MILAFDTHYVNEQAKTVCLTFNDWRTDSDFAVEIEITSGIEEYIPGEFYKRELPCILSLLSKFDLNKVECILVDGYVYLDDHYKLGLGGHLYESLNRIVPVIGVAKTRFATISNNTRHVIRGSSMNPLYVTSIGIDIEEAALLIKNMKGSNRIPTLLKKLDTLTKCKTVANKSISTNGA